jgi:predicted  nucleic acid-binding Zn-ribbon protein
MEEAKTQEIKALQFSLQEMQLQLKEIKAMFEKEREAAKRAAERLTSEKEMLMVRWLKV